MPPRTARCPLPDRPDNAKLTTSILILQMPEPIPMSELCQRTQETKFLSSLALYTDFFPLTYEIHISGIHNLWKNRMIYRPIKLSRELFSEHERQRMVTTSLPPPPSTIRCKVTTQGREWITYCHDENNEMPSILWPRVWAMFSATALLILPYPLPYRTLCPTVPFALPYPSPYRTLMWKRTRTRCSPSFS